MDKQTTVRPNHGIRLCDKKEATSDMHNLDGAQKHDAERKKPGMRGDILYDSIHAKPQER